MIVDAPLKIDTPRCNQSSYRSNRHEARPDRFENIAHWYMLEPQQIQEGLRKICVLSPRLKRCPYNLVGSLAFAIIPGWIDPHHLTRSVYAKINAIEETDPKIGEYAQSRPKLGVICHVAAGSPSPRANRQ